MLDKNVEDAVPPTVKMERVDNAVPFLDRGCPVSN